jgi:hypothetical protein
MPNTTTSAAIAMSEGWIMACLSARKEERFGPVLACVAGLGEPKRHFCDSSRAQNGLENAAYPRKTFLPSAQERISMDTNWSNQAPVSPRRLTRIRIGWLGLAKPALTLASASVTDETDWKFTSTMTSARRSLL